MPWSRRVLGIIKIPCWSTNRQAPRPLIILRVLLSPQVFLHGKGWSPNGPENSPLHPWWRHRITSPALCSPHNQEHGRHWRGSPCRCRYSPVVKWRFRGWDVCRTLRPLVCSRFLRLFRPICPSPWPPALSLAAITRVNQIINRNSIWKYNSMLCVFFSWTEMI